MRNAFITGTFAIIAAVAGALIGRKSTTNLTVSVEGIDKTIPRESVQETIHDLEEEVKRLGDENNSLKKQLEKKKSQPEPDLKSQPKPDLKPEPKPYSNTEGKKFNVGSIAVTFNRCVFAKKDGFTRCSYNILNSGTDKPLRFYEGKLVDNLGKYYNAQWHSIADSEYYQTIHHNVPTQGYFIFPDLSMKSKMASVITGKASLKANTGGKRTIIPFKVTNIEILHK